jgi:hypothetical protein
VAYGSSGAVRISFGGANTKFVKSVMLKRSGDSRNFFHTPSMKDYLLSEMEDNSTSQDT